MFFLAANKKIKKALETALDQAFSWFFRSIFSSFYLLYTQNAKNRAKKNTRKIRPIIIVETSRHRYIDVPLQAYVLRLRDIFFAKTEKFKKGLASILDRVIIKTVKKKGGKQNG